ncbi:hypothetical protein IC582_015410 [Cucumis melo]
MGFLSGLSDKIHNQNLGFLHKSSINFNRIAPLELSSVRPEIISFFFNFNFRFVLIFIVFSFNRSEMRLIS